MSGSLEVREARPEHTPLSPPRRARWARAQWTRAQQTCAFLRPRLEGLLLRVLVSSSISLCAVDGGARPLQTSAGALPLAPARESASRPPPLGWGWRLSPTEPIALSALRGRFDGADQSLLLEGEVRLQQGSQRLSCATLRLQLDEGYRPLQLSARGPLMLRSELGELRGDELSLDLQRGTLELRGSVELRRDGVRLQAARLQLNTQRRQLVLEHLRGTLSLNELSAALSEGRARSAVERRIRSGAVGRAEERLFRRRDQLDGRAGADTVRER